MTKPVTVEWQMQLPTSGTNLREHPMARKRRVESQRKSTELMLLAKSARRQMLEQFANELAGGQLRLVVGLTRVSSHALDDDNLQGAFKAIRDQVAMHFHVNDGDRSRIRFEYFQAKGSPTTVRVELNVEAAA